MDLSKAFDYLPHQLLMDLNKATSCLPHQLLVAKLKAYGVCGKSCALIWSYLSGRKQRVRVGSSTSEWILLEKGVPQGSVLGPVLFYLFINYLYAAINTCDLCNYADDNTISACFDSKQQVIDTLMAESTIAMKRTALTVGNLTRSSRLMRV